MESNIAYVLHEIVLTHTRIRLQAFVEVATFGSDQLIKYINNQQLKQILIC